MKFCRWVAKFLGRVFEAACAEYILRIIDHTQISAEVFRWARKLYRWLDGGFVEVCPAG